MSISQDLILRYRQKRWLRLNVSLAFYVCIVMLLILFFSFTVWDIVEYLFGVILIDGTLYSQFYIYTAKPCHGMAKESSNVQSDHFCLAYNYRRISFTYMYCYKWHRGGHGLNATKCVHTSTLPPHHRSLNISVSSLDLLWLCKKQWTITVQLLE